MTNPTRAIAEKLRANESIMFGPDMRDAATAIDALLDAIEAGGMVQPRQAPQMDLGPLRELRKFHSAEVLRAICDRRPAAERLHRVMIEKLNQYFPAGDRS